MKTMDEPFDGSATNLLPEAGELLPCPFCGRNFPWTYITFSCAVLRCSCGAEMHNGSVNVMYKHGEVPTALLAHTYEPTALVILKDGKEIPYPDHGYVGVNVLAAFAHAGLTAKWNMRTSAQVEVTEEMAEVACRAFFTAGGDESFERDDSEESICAVRCMRAALQAALGGEGKS